MYSYGPPHMAVQKQDDQHEHTFSSYVRIRDVVLKTYLGRWTTGRSGERGSGISVLPARDDDDDDDDDLQWPRANCPWGLMLLKDSWSFFFIISDSCLYMNHWNVFTDFVYKLFDLILIYLLRKMVKIDMIL